MRRAPIRILHIDLAQELGEIPGDPGFTETWVLFWWRTIPLGRLELTAMGHSIKAAHLRMLAARVVAPSAGAWLFPEVFSHDELLPGKMFALPELGLDREISDPLRALDALAVDATAPSSPDISVVICTRDRPDDLARCLQSLQQLRPRPLEILVVDNAPEGSATRDVVARVSDVRYVAEPRPGLSRARNAGVHAARGGIVAFTDDDVRVSPNWIAAMEHVFRDPAISVVTGLVLPAELESDSQLIFELGAGGFGQGYQRRLYDTRFFLRRRRYGAAVWRIGAGASMAIRKSLFERVGYFDERLGAGAAGCSEDSEFWYRVLADGGACCYDPRVVVHHYHRRDVAGLKRQMYLYLRGHVAALMIQFVRHRHWGNLRRLVIDIPTHQTKLAIKGALRQTKHRRHLLASEVRGTAAGILYYLRHFNQPPYPGANLENPPQAKVVSIDVDEAPGDIALERGYRELWLLARRKDTPLGWIRIPVPPGAPVVPAPVYRASLPSAWTSGVADRPADIPGPTPPISVIVCTRDRPAWLQRCLESAQCIRYPTWELIVVDNAPSDEAAAAIAARFGARYIRETRPGLDWARNRGIAEAVHDIVAFTDDDVVIDQSWLTGLARGFADPAVMAVTGLVAPQELETEAQMLFERVYGGMGKGMQGRRYQRGSLRPAELIPVQAVGVGANMAYRREAFDRVGTFDTALDVGTPAAGAGDLDMFHRVLAAGLAIQYEPRALVWHQHRRETGELRQLFYNDGRSFAVYLRKLWSTRTVPRLTLLRYTIGRWGSWLVGRVLKGLLGRHELPLTLLWAELRGAATGLRAYRATYRSDTELRQSSSSHAGVSA
jgi:GT2 family glycosyltransferase